MQGEYLNMSCVAHILSLIVKDGLGEVRDANFRIRRVVKFVKSSPA